jgi:AcrR family transcriptional regulator
MNKTESAAPNLLQSDSEPPPSRIVASGSVRRRRRTQKERSAETRALLLDVTVECLAELGYQGATAQVIAERAGLSRGAQLHHFGSKMQLVIQAMEHLFERRLVDFKYGFAQIPADARQTAAALDLLWSLVAGSAGYAYLELVIASRTDAALHAAMVALTKRMDTQIEETFDDLFDVPSDDDGMFDLVVTGLFALMEGLAMEKIVRPDDHRIDQVLMMLKKFAPSAMPARTRSL